MLNVIILTGRFTKDPILYENGENSVVSFDLAVDNYGQDAGTTFITCKAFGKVAQNVNNFCAKGSKVGVSGRLQQRNFLRKDGTKGSTYEVLCDSVEFLDPKEVTEEPEEIEVEDAPVVTPTRKPSPYKKK